VPQTLPVTQTTLPQLSAALRELTRLIKAVQYYPPTHPALKAAATGTRNAFLPLLQADDNIVCTVRKEGFFVDDDALDKTNQILQKLAAFLFARLVQHLVILPDLNTSDLISFARSLTIDPGEIRKQGGIKELLLNNHVSTIWVNETDLKSILARKQEIETARDEDLVEEADELFGPGGEELGPDLAFARERTLSDLIAQLRQVDDEEEYRTLLQELVPQVIALRTPEGRLQMLEALALLCQQASDRSREQTWRELPRYALQQICDPDGIDFLVAFLCEKELPEKRRKLLTSILTFLGQRSARRLMEHLTREDDAANRKLLAATLARQGSQAIPVLLEYLQDERWYVVRNAATILGDIRDPVVARHLQVLLHHDDIRVCCEGIRALTRIGGSRAVQILLDAIDDEDEEISRQALLSLGVIGDASAVSKLSSLIRRGDFFLKQHGRTRDAIRALGEIGSTDALPTLSGVLNHRRLFKRRPYDELRAAAAQALGDIGDVSSEPLLQRAAKDRAPEVARQAAAALKRLKRDE